MIRIAITVEAFEAIVATLGLGSVGYEPQLNAKGERMIWIEVRRSRRGMTDPPTSSADLL